MRLLLCLVCLAFGSVRAAQEGKEIKASTEAPPWHMIMQWDNDLLARSDRDYTNGIRIAFLQELAPGTETSHLLRRLLYPLTGATAHKAPADWRLRGTTDPRFAWGFGLTQLMFTPEDPTALTAPPGERPYAGWLGLELSLNAKTDRSVSGVTLALGTTGPPSYAQNVQNWTHKHISGSAIYQGWDSQVPAEPTLNLYFDHKLRSGLMDPFSSRLLGFDGYYEWGAALGNFRTDAYIGTLWRAGYNLPATVTTPRVQLGSYGHEFFYTDGPQRPAFSALVFFGLRGSAVLHDITLSGPLFRSYAGSVSVEPFVGEILAGLALRYRTAEVSISRTFRTREFKGQNLSHQFGSFMLRFSVPF